MPSDDDSSDLSSLSSLSPVPSDVELEQESDNDESQSKTGILKFFPKLTEQEPKEPSPPPRKRSPSPPHEYVLADNPDIAFIVMFRSRFTDAFPKSMANFGPQELERDVVESVPGDRVEHFLCALLGLLLNRKQDVKMGHYGRALEDAIATHKSQWPATWEDKSPLSGGATFNSMTPTERLTLLRVLILWTMASSDNVKALINQAYKGNRHEDDLNQPRAVQPWGSDADKRRYFLVEGQDDTAFRIYRESNPAGANRTWWSVAGSIEELQALADKLQTKDGGPKARALSHKMLQAIPRFEAGEDKRRRRDYRQMRKEQFKRPEPGFSMYEGRTRGKRVKYTYSDDEDVFYSDSTGQRRSARNTGTTTPAETGPLTTASGRHIRAPPRLVDDSAGGSVQGDLSDADREESVGPGGRPRRSAAVNHGTNGWSASGSRLRRGHSMDTEESESEGEFGDDEEEDEPEVPAAEESEDDEFDEEGLGEEDLDGVPRSLVVKLSVTPPKLRTVLAPIDQAPNTLVNSEMRDWKAKPEVEDTSMTALEEITPASTPAPAQVAAPVAAPAPVPKPVAEAVPEDADKMDISPPPKASQPLTIDMMLSKEDEPVRPASFPPQEAPSAQATSLAFRGSPEKPKPQQLPQPNTLGGPEQ